MQDDNQTNTPADQTATSAAPSLGNLEYSTPSAYVDPDLPLTPLPIEEPEKSESEAPTPEEPKSPEPEESPEEPKAPEPEEALEVPEESPEEPPVTTDGTMASVAEQITSADSILIALSSDPSVDELASAIGLSLFLGRLDKHAIAIYSGTTPNALEFLKPEQTFEASSDMLQDFVITISKDKADHLRYKLDGDFVKIFITPYKDRITAEDLEFSYGDFNVDLVLALNVRDEASLDAALREHGRILHDATVINITTSTPGDFGKIEWRDDSASSISEMISNLLLNEMQGTKINTEEATALLTGIVSATNRFSSNTKPSTMQIASQLVASGADPQLIATNIADGATKPTPAEPAPEPTPEPAPATPATPDLPLTFAEESPEPAAPAEPEPTPEPTPLIGNTITPLATDTTSKYQKMLDEALSEEPSAKSSAPMESALPPVTNPATSITPTIEATPDITNIPDINYGETTTDQVLPPPPAPPIDINSPMPLPSTDAMPEVPASAPAAPSISETPVAPVAPAAPEAPAAPATPPAPDAFTIPGI